MHRLLPEGFGLPQLAVLLSAGPSVEQELTKPVLSPPPDAPLGEARMGEMRPIANRPRRRVTVDPTGLQMCV